MLLIWLKRETVHWFSYLLTVSANCYFCVSPPTWTMGPLLLFRFISIHSFLTLFLYRFCCSTLNVSSVTESVDWDGTSSYLRKSPSYPPGLIVLPWLLLLFMWSGCTYVQTLNVAVCVPYNMCVYRVFLCGWKYLCHCGSIGIIYEWVPVCLRDTACVSVSLCPDACWCTCTCAPVSVCLASASLLESPREYLPRGVAVSW